MEEKDATEALLNALYDQDESELSPSLQEELQDFRQVLAVFRETPEPQPSKSLFQPALAEARRSKAYTWPRWFKPRPILATSVSAACVLAFFALGPDAERTEVPPSEVPQSMGLEAGRIADRFEGESSVEPVTKDEAVSEQKRRAPARKRLLLSKRKTRAQKEMDRELDRERASRGAPKMGANKPAAPSPRAEKPMAQRLPRASETPSRPSDIQFLGPHEGPLERAPSAASSDFAAELVASQVASQPPLNTAPPALLEPAQLRDKGATPTQQTELSAHLQRSEAARKRGAFEEAVRALNQARATAKTRFDRAEVELAQAELELARKSPRAAIARAEQALEYLGPNGGSETIRSRAQALLQTAKDELRRANGVHRSK